MEIEQYVFNMLGRPDFEVKSPVYSDLSSKKDIDWIHEDVAKEIKEDSCRKNKVKTLMV